MRICCTYGYWVLCWFALLCSRPIEISSNTCFTFVVSFAEVSMYLIAPNLLASSWNYRREQQVLTGRKSAVFHSPVPLQPRQFVHSPNPSCYRPRVAGFYRGNACSHPETTCGYFQMFCCTLQGEDGQFIVKSDFCWQMVCKKRNTYRLVMSNIMITPCAPR